MTNQEIKEILRQQMELLAKAAKNVKTASELSLISEQILNYAQILSEM